MEHLSPEVLSARHRASRSREAAAAPAVSLARQSVFEVGVSIAQLIVYPMVHPLPGYPFAFESGGVVSFDVAAAAKLPTENELAAAGYPVDFVVTMRRMLECDPGKRPSLRECRVEFLGMGAEKLVSAVFEGLITVFVSSRLTVRSCIVCLLSGRRQN